MFQYQIYPTGNISNYKIKVNNVGGVSAILDRMMGITEYSLSGVAFYIKAISDYVNQNNVGTSDYPINSGYFNHIGFKDYVNRDYTLDCIISGVSNIYCSGINILTSDIVIDKLSISSGFFNNVVIDQGFKGETVINDIRISGIIENIYSGYLNSVIPLTQNTPITSETDYPFYLGGSGILNDILIRPRIETSNNQNGISDGSLTATNEFRLNNITGVNTSGHLYLFGLYKPNLSDYSTPSNFDESIFSMTSHTHDGVDSAQLSLESFNSNKTITENFNLIQQSGSIIIKDFYNGNAIGLSSNWEKVDLDGVDNIQQLISCKNKLYGLDEEKLIDFETEESIMPLSLNTQPKAHIFSTVYGDKPCIINMITRETEGMTGENVIGMNITFFDSNLDYLVYFPNTPLDNSESYITSRKEILVDTGIRNGKNFYITFLEQDTAGGENLYFSLYELDTITRTLKQVARCDIDDEPRRFYKPIKYKNSLIYFVLSASAESYCFVYNMLYRPERTYPVSVAGVVVNYLNEYYTFSYNPVNFSLFMNDPTIVSSGSLTSVGIENIPSGNITTTTRNPLSYTHYNGRPYFITSYGGGFINTFEKNRVCISTVNSFESTSVISYAGKLWYGSALHISRNVNNAINVNTDLLNKLKEITGLTEPWLMSPIVYKGWLYAIAPTVAYDTWKVSGASTYIDVNNTLPPGSIVVRRRASETDLIEMQAYTL